MIGITADANDVEVDVHADYDCKRGMFMYEAMTVLAEVAYTLKERYPSGWAQQIKDKTLEDVAGLSGEREEVKENEQQ